MATLPVTEMTFDDDVRLRRVERLPRLSKDESIIIAFTVLDDLGAPRIKNSYVHMLLKDKGHPQTLAIRAPDPDENPDLARKCVARWGQPRIQFVTPVFRYASDPSGEYIRPCSGQVYVFRFGQDKFPMLKQIHRSWGLGKVDVQIMCHEPTFQKVTMQPKPGEPLWRDPSSFANEAVERIMTDSQIAYDMLDNEIGRVLEDDQIEGLLDGVPLDAQGGGGESQWSPFSQSAQAQTPPLAQNPPRTPDFTDVVETRPAPPPQRFMQNVPPGTTDLERTGAPEPQPVPVFGESRTVGTVGGTPFGKPD